jgi:hypothetical protein
MWLPLGHPQINHAKADLDLQRTRRRPHRKTTLGACGKEMIRLVLKGQHRRSINVGVGTLIRSPGTIMSRPKQERTSIRTGVRTGGRQQLVIGILNGNLVSRAEASNASLEVLIIEKSRANLVVAGGDTCIFFFPFESDDIVGPPNLLSLIFH